MNFAIKILEGFALGVGIVLAVAAMRVAFHLSLLGG